MCGIIGLLGREDAKEKLACALSLLQNRGRDHTGTYIKDDVALGHLLHALVDHVEQPFVGEGVLVANCEIYNWRQLSAEFHLFARNDAELLFKLLERTPVDCLDDVLDLLDGVYAFAYLREGKLFLARDLLGVKPLWYSPCSGFAFASERKALLACDYYDVHELNPRQVLVYDLSGKSVSFVQRDFFSLATFDAPVAEVVARTHALVATAVKKRVPQQKFGLLFSGGLDSTVLALLLKKLGYAFTCYCCVFADDGLKTPEDLVYAQKVAAAYNLDLRVVAVSLTDVEDILVKIVPLIEDTNVVKVGVALTFFAACAAAAKDGCKVLFSGLGSEEIFAGYQRHKDSYDVNKECLSGLRQLYERDLYRDDVVSMYHSLEMRLPFLDHDLVSYALTISPDLKIKDGVEKYILRLVAQDVGLSDEFALRPKKAAQYGSNFHKALVKLTKKSGERYISSYLRRFYPACNVRLAALLSSGKDSVYAAYTMLKRNYDVACFVTLFSANKDSYMFHTPAIEMVRLQSESIGIPLLEQVTAGEKEKELEDLKLALLRAKQEYGVQGVVCGALYSSYQRDRIEKVCDALGLKVFAPLWHVDQEYYMRELLDSGFSFILTHVAADGLDSSWLNREITSSDVDALVRLHGVNKLNVAFEGGEAESLMVSGPWFTSSISLDKTSIVADGSCATLLIEDASLASFEK